VIFSFVDITERKRAEETLAHQSLHDALTGLPNRTLLMDRLQQAFSLADRRRGQSALMLIDLDRFKDVNDTFGHHVGDFLLLEVGARMKAALRESDTVARLGGDEFAVVLTEVGSEDGVLHAAEKLVEALEQPFLLEGETVDIGASMGIALFPEHGREGPGLLRHADVAMYTAKRRGGGIQLYSDDQDPHSAKRLGLKTELRAALENDELLLHYQPKVLLGDRHALLVEALVRWQHPTRGLVMPDDFVPFAEQVGLMRALTEWVLDAGLRQCRVWHDQGLPVSIAINLSMSNLHDHLLPESVRQAVEDAGLAPEWVKLEVTESTVMNQPQRVLRTLHELREMGFELSIDDFGTGYSSLAYLRRLPVNEIKIDKSFIREMTVNSSDDVIVRSTIELGHNLGLLVVAEGVEDAVAWHRLKELGCDAIQGYYIARPMAEGDASRWLRESPWAGAAPSFAA
jgi:diguanylate cyclase (GGDEF)-like protein